MVAKGLPLEPPGLPRSLGGRGSAQLKDEKGACWVLFALVCSSVVHLPCSCSCVSAPGCLASGSAKSGSCLQSPQAPASLLQQRWLTSMLHAVPQPEPEPEPEQQQQNGEAPPAAEAAPAEGEEAGDSVQEQTKRAGV